MRDAYADLLLAPPVEQLVPGDPVGIDQLAQTMLRWSELFADAARALRRVDVVWTGSAADAFWGEFQLQPAAFAAAATSLDSAANAIGSYGIAFHSAREAAATALETFQRGLRAGLAARAVAKIAAGAAGGLLPTTSLVDLRDEPAGLQDRLTGVEKLTAVREALLEAGDRATTTVRDAMATAPRQVSTLEHGQNFAAGMLPWVSNPEKADFYVGGARGLLDMGAQAMMPVIAPVVMSPVNQALDGLEWRWNIGSGSGFHQAGAFVIPAIATGGGGGVAVGLEARAPRALADIVLPKGVNQLPHELVAFGNSTRLSRLRLGKDISPGADGYVNTQNVQWPDGQSTFIDPKFAPLKGYYYSISKDTLLPPGVLVVRDGIEVTGPHTRGHATIYPTERMTSDQFQQLIDGLPWQRAGRK